MYIDHLPFNPTYTTAAALALVLVACLMFYPASLLRWLQRKRYQYEVTFSLYMMTPTEKFIFNSILFLFLAMVTIAASLYLPEHIATVARRAYYYAAGNDFESVAAGNKIAEASRTLASRLAAATSALVKDGGQEAARTAGRAAVDAAGAAGGEL